MPKRRYKDILPGKKTYLAAFGFLLLFIGKFLAYGEFDPELLLMALAIFGLRKAIEKIEK